MPRDAEAHGNLGAALHDRGLWAQALASLRRALELDPNDVQVLVDAANALKALGRAREAAPLYQRALELDPRSSEAHNNLGNAFLELGRAAEAEGCYRRALELEPSGADIRCNLGNVLRIQGRLEEAIASTLHALAANPASSIAHNNLGLCLAGLGRRAEAAASYRQALELNPGYVEALNNLGNVLPELGERREALALFARAIELDPARAESHCNLGNVLFEFRRIEEAAASYRRALALEPRNVAALAGLGAAQRMQGRAAEAEASCRAALAVDSKAVSALSLLGEIRADRGQFTEAEELFRRTLDVDPGFPFAYYSIATNRKMTSADAAWLAGTEALLGRPLPLRHEISLHYARGKYFDDLTRYEEAFASYRLANELVRRYGVEYDRAGVAERVDRVIESFDAASIRRLQSHGPGSERPVFIVGMPRSGTSLTEQILASHPAVFGAGELPFWQSAFTTYEAAGLESHAAAGLISGMAQEYLDRLGALSSDAQRVVDKMPLNFMSVGLILAAFPRARIIHLKRHPIDTCLSIYFHYFSHLHPYANDLDNLAHYYGEYRRVTDHWRAVLPAANFLEISYEALIGDQEGWTRRMLEFVGLPWDPKCLDFHETDRVVITLSKWQVRQKMHTGSAGRFRNYERFLGPLEALATSG
jgi:tetratricopeptide (TPR) repeat protein